MKDRFLFFLAPALLLTALMVSDQSFWIDEGSTGLFARQPTFSAWLHYMQDNISSEAQMPLSLFFTWLWAQAMGTGEVQLRALNLVWAGATLWALALAGKRLAIPWLPLFCAIQPYFWLYTDEARPYALEIASGSWLLVAFVDFWKGDRSEVWWALVFACAALVLSCATMLAPIPLVAVGAVGAAVAIRERRTVPSQGLRWIGAGAILTVPLAIYYAQTLVRGAKGAALWNVDARYLAYVAYETLGISGLGPANSELREIARSIRGAGAVFDRFGQFTAPLLCAVVLGILLLFGQRALRRERMPNPAHPLLSVFLLGCLLFFGASLAAQKAFWARHYAPLFPFYVTSTALFLAAAARGAPPWVFRPLAGLFVAQLCYSSLSLRFAERHRKDDYRGAAAIAKQALSEGKAVWWVAAPESGEYYGVPLTYSDPKPGSAFCPQPHTGIPSSRANRSDINRFSAPDLVLVSKPDIFDTSGTIAAYLARNHFTPSASLKAFRIWRAPVTTIP